MPQSLAPIPADYAIVDPRGRINTFFRLRWQQLIDGFQVTPSKANVTVPGRNSALGTTTLYLALAAGRYRVTVYLRKTTPDGVSSSLTLTVGWTDEASPCTKTFGALTTDSAVANESYTHTVNVDVNTNITIAVAYASNTPGTMVWKAYAVAEVLA